MNIFLNNYLKIIIYKVKQILKIIINIFLNNFLKNIPFKK